MTVVNDDWPVVASNFQKYRKSWGRMLRILIQGGRGGSDGVRSILQGGIPVGVAVWVEDVSPDPQDGAGPE